MPFIFDGNNIIGQSAAQARADPAPRRAFLDLLGRCAAGRRAKLIVFFDGDLAERTLPPRGVQVRFSAPLSSDQAILDAVAGARRPAELVVVTNDRALATRCRQAGARAMDWSEFASRLARWLPPSPGEPLKEKPVDLDEWSEFFGFDPDELK